MAQDKSNKKGRVDKVVVVSFVVITIVLILLQLGMNVIDTIEQQSVSHHSTSETAIAMNLNARAEQALPLLDIRSLAALG